MGPTPEDTIRPTVLPTLDEAHAKVHLTPGRADAPTSRSRWGRQKP